MYKIIYIYIYICLNIHYSAIDVILSSKSWFSNQYVFMYCIWNECRQNSYDVRCKKFQIWFGTWTLDAWLVFLLLMCLQFLFQSNIQVIPNYAFLTTLEKKIERWIIIYAHTEHIINMYIYFTPIFKYRLSFETFRHVANRCRLGKTLSSVNDNMHPPI